MPDATPPPGVDTTRPSPARLYDFALGGTDNYQVDRETAAAALAVDPDLKEVAINNRAWLRRVVRYLCEQGIRQFLDIGSGLPTVENVHEVAQRIAPESRVVYVDHDPSVLVHARALLADLDDAGHTGFLLGDLRDPDAIVESDEVARLIDPSRPVGLIMSAVLHFVADADDPGGLAGRLARWLPAGSHVAISHTTSEGAPPKVLDTLDVVYREASERLCVRSRAEITRILDAVDHAAGGTTMVEPGLVPVHEWRQDEPVDDPPVRILGAVLHLHG